MQANPDQLNIADYPLQLLLFIDKRPSSREQVRQVGTALKELREECEFELQIIDVSEQPYLAEYFRLIATPALIKIHPEPRQTLAGSTLVQQLQHWWIHWQRSVAEYSASTLASAAGSGAMEVRSLKQTLALEIAAVTPQTGDSMGAPFSNAPIANLESPILSEAEQSTLRSLKDSFDSSASFNLVTRSTELIRLSDEVFRLKREKEDLEHQLQFKDQILAMLAHDLRNPLTATSIALETLERDCNPQDGIESSLTLQLKTRLLNHARTQTRAIDRMITDVLQAARGIGSDARIHPHKLDLGALCVDVLNDLQDRFQEKSQQVETDIPSDLPMILADGERIRQVLTNLLDNAVKYTPPGGTIQLAALHRTTQKVQISVGDNGPGIPPENQERIFEERFRLKRDEDKEGYGLGLSLCQRIIRAHYGQIWVDSTSNHGSCFHFTLPVFRK